MDLMTGTYTYEKLANQYGNFIAPAMKIKSGGTNILEDSKISVPNIHINLPVDGSAVVSFQVAGAYDAESHSFSGKVKDSLALGTVIEIEIGYLSATTLVFKGYVAAMGVDFSGNPTLTVNLADARKLMMEGMKIRAYTKEHYSEAYEEVMKDYSKLCKLVTDATEETLTDPVGQSSNDYEFIMDKLLKKEKLEREFFILAGKAYFRKPTDNSDVIMTVEYGRELLSFSKQDYYGGAKVNVLGYDDEKGEKIMASAETKAPGKQKKAMVDSPQWYIMAPRAKTESLAKQMAKEEAERKKKREVGGSAEVVGLPEMVPGRYVKVDGMDSLANGVYYISSVSHQIGNGGFRTTLELGGRK